MCKICTHEGDCKWAKIPKWAEELFVEVSILKAKVRDLERKKC